MKTATEIYEDADAWGWSDYQPMLNEFGKIHVQREHGEYQGDTRVLYSDESGRYGYLCFGYGSCSGCDALQGCDTIGQVQELMDELCAAVKWYDTPALALEFFKTHDWAGDYDSDDEFVQQCITYLQEL